MQEITMFTQNGCPYCKRARAWMDELLEDPAYRSLPLTIIEENEQPDVAARYDYYYVPTYFVGGKKLHEGAASPEIIRKVFDAAKEA